MKLKEKGRLGEMAKHVSLGAVHTHTHTHTHTMFLPKGLEENMYTIK